MNPAPPSPSPDEPSADEGAAFDGELEVEVAELMAQDAACRTALELAVQLPPPSLDDFLS